MNVEQFQRYRDQFPPDRLKQYAGKYVVWNAEGTQIVASSDNPKKAAQQADEAGYDSASCVLSYVPRLDEIFLGGESGS